MITYLVYQLLTNGGVLGFARCYSEQEAMDTLARLREEYPKFQFGIDVEA